MKRAEHCSADPKIGFLFLMFAFFRHDHRPAAFANSKGPAPASPDPLVGILPLRALDLVFQDGQVVSGGALLRHMPNSHPIIRSL